MIADDLAFRTFDAASARFVYELAAMRRTVQACQKREMVAGWALTGSNLADVGLNSAKLAVTYVDGSSLVADHGFTTDHIGEKSFEKVLSPNVMKIGVAQGFGCNTDKPQDERDLTSTLDTFRHEIAAAYNVKGRGLVVLTSCSHRGVVNAIKQAQPASGIAKVHAVIGGFHLGRLRPRGDRRHGGDGYRPCHSAPLHGRTFLRNRECGNAVEIVAVLYRNAVCFWNLTSVLVTSPNVGCKTGGLSESAVWKAARPFIVMPPAMPC